MFCSNDPVCSLSHGQGRDSLNLAACHSCSLLPETCCEEYNTFLDRGVVSGTYDNKKLGLYYDQLFGKGWEIYKNLTQKFSVSHSLKIDKRSGINCKDTSFKDIWKDLFDFADSEDERLTNELLQMYDMFDNKEKPTKNCYIFINERKFKCDLVFEKSKVLIFSTDNEEGYNCSKTSDWKCYLLSDKNIKADTILDALQG